MEVCANHPLARAVQRDGAVLAEHLTALNENARPQGAAEREGVAGGITPAR
jgi:hypothetical protein